VNPPTRPSRSLLLLAATAGRRHRDSWYLHPAGRDCGDDCGPVFWRRAGGLVDAPLFPYSPLLRHEPITNVSAHCRDALTSVQNGTIWAWCPTRPTLFSGIHTRRGSVAGMGPPARLRSVVGAGHRFTIRIGRSVRHLSCSAVELVAPGLAVPYARALAGRPQATRGCCAFACPIGRGGRGTEGDLPPGSAESAGRRATLGSNERAQFRALWLAGRSVAPEPARPSRGSLTRRDRG
jgi:hypothetical protein